MSKNVLERMEEIDAKTKIANFMVKQKQPYEFKKRYAEMTALKFVEECYKRDLNFHVSVGGLDSITLFLFLKSIGINAPGVSVSYLEDKSIQEVHKQLGLIRITSAKKADGTAWNKSQILQEFGFPVLSKEVASKIEHLQSPTEKNATVRHAIITGETGAYGGWQKNSKMKLAQKWLNLFAGYENENENVNYQIAPFKVSSKCCYYLKEKSSADWSKEHNSVPFLGLMASEGGRREKSLMINGCNYFGKSTIRSAPFAIFNRQDILQLALELNVPIPAIYGTIEKDEKGMLYTTRAQRTGCSMCGFGIQLERKRPHRFDRLREDNPKEWHYWMYECCTDENGEKYGWGRVLDYIGIGWEDDPYQANKKKDKELILPGQINMFG
jgi:3'-phosphoadenosine 5'-phosphosulfate sulfotransferase (PAPS reductase)/FAD synthetase